MIYYITRDDDGSWYLHRTKPTYVDERGEWVSSSGWIKIDDYFIKKDLSKTNLKIISVTLNIESAE